MIQVTKYANRKLYDRGNARYASMLGLSDMVARGEGDDGVDDGGIEVMCDRTGRDVTLETLARALYERVKVRDAGRSTLRPRDVASLIKKVARVK